MGRVVVDLLSIRDNLHGTGTHEKKIESAGNVSVGLFDLYTNQEG
jgi:hypothetical protein